MSEQTNTLLSHYANAVHIMSGARGNEQEFIDPGYKAKREGDIRQLMEFIGEYPDITVIEDVVSRYKASLQRIKNDTIPQILFELEQSSCELLEGLSITMKQSFNFVINGSDDNEKTYNKERLYEWFVQNGYKDIFKTIFELGKGDDQNVKRVEEVLSGNGASYKLSQDVHHKTIQATLKKHVRYVEDEIARLEKQFKNNSDKAILEEINSLRKSMFPPEDIARSDIFMYADVKRSRE